MIHHADEGRDLKGIFSKVVRVTCSFELVKYPRAVFTALTDGEDCDDIVWSRILVNQLSAEKVTEWLA